jgi:hypothetical protein
MEPCRYLEKTAAAIDQLNTSKESDRVLDELEFIHEALEPEFQDLASTLIEKLALRRKSID